MMAGKLKVGIIGLGGIANLHAGGWEESPLAEVVAGCDINADVFEPWEKKRRGRFAAAARAKP